MMRCSFPIRYILLAAFVFAGLLPTILIATLAFEQTRNALKIQIEHDLQTRAVETASEIDRMMFERLQNVASWSHLEIMQDLRIDDVDKRLSKFLADLKSNYPDVYQEIRVMDLQGKVVASSLPQDINQALPKREVWQAASLNNTTLMIGHLEQRMLPITAPIYDQQQSVIGYLEADFNWDQIEHVLQTSAGEQQAAALIDQKGLQIANSTAWQQVMQSPSIHQHARMNGYESFSGFGWQVEMREPREIAYAAIHQLLMVTVGLLIVTIFMAAILAWTIGKSITNPLKRLTTFANQFILTPTSLLPPQGGPQEIQVMSEAFTKMMADLETSKEQLTRAAKLAVVGEMAAAMSHEVRTPLGILRSSAQLLQREPQLSDEGREVCGFINSETERLNRLVTTLIEAARPKPPQLVSTNLVEVIQQVITLLKLQADRKSIQIQFESSEQVWMHCDTEQILQVILNLVLNAIQLLPEGGHIQILLRQIQIAGTQTEQVELSHPSSIGYAEIVVSDNGPGIANEDLQQVFDPFFTKRAGGVGLGLAVVRQIIMAHHGSILVNNGALGGAEFIIRLPMTHESIKTEQA